jgi:hypothetical protein
VGDEQAARQPRSDRFGTAVEGVVRALGALTGAAAIVYALGALVMARRLQAAGLPWRDTMAALPRDQILASGTIELGYSLLGALLIILTGVAFVALAQLASMWREDAAPARFLLGGLIVFSLVSLIGVPFNAVGLICLGLLVGLTMWLYAVIRPMTTRQELASLRRDLLGRSPTSDWSRRPTGWVALLLTAIIVVLSVGRIWSFPDGFQLASATVERGSPVRDALYIGSGSQYVVLGALAGGRVVFLRTDSVQRLDLRDGPAGAFSRSLSSRVGFVRLTAFYPTFRRDPS